MRISTLFIAICTILGTAAAETLTSSDGKVIEAELLQMKGEDTIEVRSAGKTFDLELARLSAESRQLVDRWQKSRRAAFGAEVKALNELIGQPLFSPADRLFEEGAAALAKRLKWRKESQTPYTSSYRSYPPDSYRFCGARPYSAAIYGDRSGTVGQVSLVFANKGDFFSTSGSALEHFTKNGEQQSDSSFEAAMKQDHKIISTCLTKQLGEGTRQRFGEGKDRRTVTRWDWNGHALLLALKDEEYVSLVVSSTAFADNKGSTGRTADEKLRNQLAGNVKRSENGDVVIGNIPMVDQGPKGYCVPATFERAMRYMGVPADMYLLATAGGTSKGGGTNTAQLFDEVRSAVYRKSRRPKDIDLRDLKVRRLQRYIDRGVPIIWRMRSLPEYNQIAIRRTQERKKVADLAAYAEKIKAEAEEIAPTFVDAEFNHHVCMIIGYNEATDEVAVSDSWGPHFALRWVHRLEAEAVSGEGGFVIDL